MCGIASNREGGESTFARVTLHVTLDVICTVNGTATFFLITTVYQRRSATVDLYNQLSLKSHDIYIYNQKAILHVIDVNKP